MTNGWWNMDLKQYEHLAPEGATHLFTDTAWGPGQVYAYMPNNNNGMAYSIKSKGYYGFTKGDLEQLRKSKTAVIWEIPLLNLENV